MESVMSWFVVCLGGLVATFYILREYVRHTPMKSDRFAAYTADKCAWWDK